MTTTTSPGETRDSGLLDSLQARIGHRFADHGLLRRALTHMSYLQDHPEESENNQRLEFLGDAVLQLVLAEALFSLYPAEREGNLTRRRAMLAKGSFLASLAREIDLPPCLRLGQSEESTGGRNRSAALEDAFEALVGAVYMDAGWDRCRTVVVGLYGDLGGRLAGLEDFENPKGRLQELVQPALGNEALRYALLGTTGEEHARTFESGVYLFDRLLGSGSGSSKKTAEEAAARAALQALRRDGVPSAPQR
ncbi:ribonuclease 3 [mine drainage metagenome]|uniref:ribonuclease III n=1 Tax=mine drainage metagenome TaxID=410659 RepID=A0A1J5TBA1_9ZZZZ